MILSLPTKQHASVALAFTEHVQIMPTILDVAAGEISMSPDKTIKLLI